MAYVGERRALAVRTVERVVRAVFDGEQAPNATVTVSFLSQARMRRMNRETFGHDRATDVIAFGLPHDDTLVGDVYVCPAVARRSAQEHHVPVRQELIRLVVHGLLHVLGLDHPAGASRTRSPMWRRQEAYVDQLVGVRVGANDG